MSTVRKGLMTRKAVAASRLAPDAEAGRSLRKEELERLRALGYVQ